MVTYGKHKGEFSTDHYPLNFAQIKKAQLAMPASVTALQSKVYHEGGRTFSLLTHNDKIFIPKPLQERITKWYHEILLHPGVTRTAQTIKQHFIWPKMTKTIDQIVGKCHICQTCKRDTRKYGQLPEKTAEAEPWDQLCVDLIGPYKIKQKQKPPLILWCVTMIDPATGWFEMTRIENKEAIEVANKVEQTWLTRYPRPTIITYDKGTEFMAEFGKMVEQDYGIVKKPITTRNPQANAIIERIHQTIGNSIRTFEVHKMEIKEKNPWDGILAAVMYATRATYHTTLQATPMQLVFGRDALLKTKFEADWSLIRAHKQKLIRKNNERENKKRVPHTYHVGDKVLLKTAWTAKFDGTPYSGPYTIRRVNTNGTVVLKQGAVLETINMRNIKPYQT